MLEALVLLLFFSALTLGAAVLYGRRIKEASVKYLQAKSVIDDIVLSFSRQLKRQGDTLEVSSRKVDVLNSRSERLAKELKEQKKVVQSLAEKVESLPHFKTVLTRVDALEKKFEGIASAEDALAQRIAEVEKRRLRQKESEVRVESAIPIRREKALAPLTETELTVLELLASEGEKTAPEIKERVKLSREHTARLMKKLYEKGYLERSANKIPFTYRLKEEMQKLLRKPEQKG